MSSKKEIPFDDALELLSNGYRREILRLITLKDRYAFELSKLLDISQRAVSNHLTALKDAGLVESDKRKSDKGPKREYFQLNQAVVLSLTVAPNLFLATLRNLDDTPINQFATITPDLQLGSSSKSSFKEVIEEGLELLPQIKEGLQLLETQQSKLLRGYQGIRNHIREMLEKNDFTTSEIRLLLLLIEHDGEMTQEQILLSLDQSSTDILQDYINPLKVRELVETQYFDNTKGETTFKVILI